MNNELLDQLLPFVPEAWRSKIALVALASPYITRAFYALANGRGIKGVLSSIWLGTNTPKPTEPKP